MLLLVACVHTPPHDPPGGMWRVDTEHRAQMTYDGTWCSWDAENLRYDGQDVWAVPPPDVVDGEHTDEWCTDGGEAARTVDVLAQDGPFLSTRVRTEGCCPARVEVACVTWDLRTRAPATLVAYDEKHAERRWARLQELVATDPSYAGWTFTPDAWLLRGGHVAFCGIRGDEVREVQVR